MTARYDGLFAKLDNGFWSNDKVATLAEEHPHAFAVWVRSISYSSDKMADGAISAFAARHLLFATDEDIRILIDRKLWVKSRRDGFEVHDYLKYQMAKGDVEKLHNVRSESGRKGGKARWHNDSSDGKRLASAKANAMASAKASASRLLRSKTMADIDIDKDIDIDIDKDSSFSLSSSSNEDEDKKKKTSHPTQVDMNGLWVPSKTTLDWIKTTYPTLNENETRTRFAGHWLGEKKSQVEWDRLYRGWASGAAHRQGISAAKPHHHTWLCAHTLAITGIPRDRASDGNNRLILEYTAAGLNKGLPPQDAVKRAKQIAGRQLA